MVNPGTYTGLRLAFLDGKNEEYSNAVKMNIVDDVVSNIQRQYFKRFPITLPLNEEPTAEWLAQVDDNAPDPEILPPNEKDYATSDEYVQAMFKYDEMGRELVSRKASIKRRLLYNYNKQRKALAASKADDPMRAVADKFLGIDKMKKPRMKTPYNIWGPEHRCIVEPIFKHRVHIGAVPAKQQLALRSAIYKELFDELPEDERQEYIDRAELEHEEALEQMYTKLRAPASQKPEDLQLAIESVTGLLSPLLDIISERTGFKWSCFGGGPEPADGGRINIISIHSGVTTGSVKMNFARSERVDFKRYIIPIFGAFVQKCYTVAECRARALDSTNTFATKLSDLQAEEGGFDVHHVGPMVERKKTSDEILVARMKAKEDHKRRRDKELKKGSVPQQGSTSTPTPVVKDAPPIKIGPPKGKKKTKNGTDTVDASSSGVVESDNMSKTTKVDSNLPNSTCNAAVADASKSTDDSSDAAAAGDVSKGTSNSTRDAAVADASKSTDNSSDDAAAVDVSKGTTCDAAVADASKSTGNSSDDAATADVPKSINKITSDAAVADASKSTDNSSDDATTADVSKGTNNSSDDRAAVDVSKGTTRDAAVADASKSTNISPLDATTADASMGTNNSTCDAAVADASKSTNNSSDDASKSADNSSDDAAAIDVSKVTNNSTGDAVANASKGTNNDNNLSDVTSNAATGTTSSSAVSGLNPSSKDANNDTNITKSPSVFVGTEDDDNISNWTRSASTASNGVDNSATPSSGSTRLGSMSKGTNDSDDISNWTGSTSAGSNGIGVCATSPDGAAGPDSASKGTMDDDVACSAGPAASRSSSPALQIAKKLNRIGKTNQKRQGGTGKGDTAGGLPSLTLSKSPLPNMRKSSPVPLSARPPGAAAMLEYSDDEEEDITPPESLRKRKSADDATTDNSPVVPRKKAKTSEQSLKRKSQASQGGPKKKRQRLSAEDLEDLELAFDIVIPDGHADWVPGALALLASTDLGGQWKALVQAWLLFEHSQQYAETKLSPKGRPQAIADWINRGRPHTYRPVVNVKTFESGFKNWWKSLQPEWRHCDGSGGLAKSDNGNWDTLRYTGPNGLLSVLAGLFFWGIAGTDDAWHAAADDVLYAIQCMH